jgi:uncharacterized surface protein with fasciclin (FAS1) repeats
MARARGWERFARLLAAARVFNCSAEHATACIAQEANATIFAPVDAAFDALPLDFEALLHQPRQANAIQSKSEAKQKRCSPVDSLYAAAPVRRFGAA